MSLLDVTGLGDTVRCLVVDSVLLVYLFFVSGVFIYSCYLTLFFVCVIVLLPLILTVYVWSVLWLSLKANPLRWICKSVSG